MKTILCYGDSNTYGYNPRSGMRYPKEIRWTSILGDFLKDDYEVIAEGLNGRTTAYDRDGEDSRNGLKHFVTIFNSHRPIDYLIFMLGTNDCNKELGLSSKQICDGMEKLVVLAKKTALDKQGYLPVIILIAPAPVLDNYHDSPFVEQLDDFSIIKSHELSGLYKELSKKENCLFLDASGIEVSQIDAEHLTIRGHYDLAKRVKEFFAYENKS